jgi:hypothetical protein
MLAGIFEYVVVVNSDEATTPATSSIDTAAAADTGTTRIGDEGGSRSRAVVGGVDYAVGGWGAYEIDRRRARWAHGGGRVAAHYAGRTYIHAEDAVQSILGGATAATGRAGGRSVLQRAALRLADTLGRIEDVLCEPDEDGVWECRALRGDSLTIPAVTSADLRAFAADAETDPEAMADLASDVAALVDSTGSVLAPLPPLAAGSRLPALPSRAVPIDDDAAVLQLEADVGPYIASLEDLRAALATRLSAAADILDSRKIE